MWLFFFTLLQLSMHRENPGRKEGDQAATQVSCSSVHTGWPWLFLHKHAHMWTERNLPLISCIASIVMVLSSSMEWIPLMEGINVSRLNLCTNKGSIIPLTVVIKWFIPSTRNWVLLWYLLDPKPGGVQWSILLTKDLKDNPISSVQPWYGPLRFEVQMETSQEWLHFTSLQVCSAWQADFIGRNPSTVSASLFCKSLSTSTCQVSV